MLFLYLLPRYLPLARKLWLIPTPILGCVFVLGTVVSRAQRDRAYVTADIPNQIPRNGRFWTVSPFRAIWIFNTRRIPVQLRACRGRQTGHFGGNAGKHRLLAATLMTRIDYLLLLFIVEMMNTFYVLCRGRLGQGAWLCSIGRRNTTHFCVVDSDRNSKTDISQWSLNTCLFPH